MKWKKIIKELVYTAITIFILTNIFSWFYAPTPSSETLPAADFVLINGQTYHVDKDKPVVIHFWATWCRVCKMEASNIDAVAKRYEVVTIAVNSGSNEDIRRYMETHDLHFHVYNDEDGAWAKRFDVSVFPTTFVYDSHGVLKFAEVGYTTTAGLLTRLKLAE